MCTMLAKEWLDENEWENRPIESDAFSHYTMLDTLMEEYAKHYLTEYLGPAIILQLSFC